jgi:hypothetical protein
MSRDIPADLEAAIDQPVVRPFFALFIDLPDPVRCWSGVGAIEFEDADGDPQVWIGTGELGALDPVGESADGSATGMKATLFSVPAEFRDDIADQATKGARFEVYVGSANETFQTVEAAQLIWKGRVDEYRITDAGETIGVEVTGESRGIDQRRPAIKRFTDEYQQRQHSGDLFFQFVPQMTEISILWAQAEQKSAAPVVGSSFAGGGFVGGTARALSA